MALLVDGTVVTHFIWFLSPKPTGLLPTPVIATVFCHSHAWLGQGSPTLSTQCCWGANATSTWRWLKFLEAYFKGIMALTLICVAFLPVLTPSRFPDTVLSLPPAFCLLTAILMTTLDFFSLLRVLCNSAPATNQRILGNSIRESAGLKGEVWGVFLYTIPQSCQRHTNCSTLLRDLTALLQFIHSKGTEVELYRREAKMVTML